MGEQLPAHQPEVEFNPFDDFTIEIEQDQPEVNEQLRWQTIAELESVFGAQEFQYGSHTGTVATIVEVCPHIKDMLVRGSDAHAIGAEIAPYAVQDQPVPAEKSPDVETIAHEHASLEGRNTDAVEPSAKEAADSVETQALEANAGRESRVEADEVTQSDISVEQADSQANPDVVNDATENLTAAVAVAELSDTRSDTPSDTDAIASPEAHATPPEAELAKDIELAADIEATVAIENSEKSVDTSELSTDETVEHELPKIVTPQADKETADLGRTMDIDETRPAPINDFAATLLLDKKSLSQMVPIETESHESTPKQPSIDPEFTASSPLEEYKQIGGEDESEYSNVPHRRVESTPLTVGNIELSTSEEAIAANEPETIPDTFDQVKHPEEDAMLTEEPTELVVHGRGEKIDEILDTSTSDELVVEAQTEASDDEDNELGADFAVRDDELHAVDTELMPEPIDYLNEPTEMSELELTEEDATDLLIDTIESAELIDGEPEQHHEDVVDGLEHVDVAEGDESAPRSILEAGLEGDEQTPELSPAPIAEISHDIIEIIDIPIDETAEYDPVRWADAYRELHHNIQTLQQATSAEECSDALEAIRDSLIELLDAIGCYDAEYTARYLLKQHTIDELQLLLKRLQKTLSDNNRATHRHPTVSGISRLIGRHVMAVYVGAVSYGH